MKNFFVSYNSADRSWAEWIAWCLEEVGYEVVIQAWDFRPGSNFVLEMDGAAKESERTIAVLSPSYLSANYTQSEWADAFAKDPTGEKGSLLPVRVRECELKGLLAQIVYVDLVGLEEDAARNALLKGIKHERVKPASPPDFPGRAQFPGSLPQIWRVPHNRNRNFIDREELLTNLRDALASGNHPALTQVIIGLGGVGKTQLAVEYAYRYAREYDIVWWLRAEEVATLGADYAALAEPLELPVVDVKEQPVIVEAVKEQLGQIPGWLLIFDNATDAAGVRDYLPQGTGHVIITSRNPDWGGVANPLPVEVFERSESIRLLLSRTVWTDGTDADELADALGDLPLALEQAGAYIEASGSSFSEYLKLLSDYRVELLSRRSISTDYPDTVATTWEISFRQVKEESPAGAELLNLCAFLAPDDIPKELLRAGTEHLPKSLADSVADSLAFNDALAALRRYSLIEVESDVLSVHQLVQAAVRDRLGEDILKMWAEAAVRLVNNTFLFDSDDVGTWHESSRLLPHALAATEHAERYKVAPEETGHLLKEVGLYWRERESFAEARRVFERAFIIYKDFYGNDHPKVASIYDNLGLVLSHLGDLEGAKNNFERALAIYNRVYGNDHPEVVNILDNLGKIDVAKALKMNLEENINTAIQSIHSLITPRFPPESFLYVSKTREKAVITKLCEAYYYLLKDAKGRLKNVVDIFEETQGIKYGRELYLIYKSLHSLSKAKAIDDILAIEPEIIEILGYDDVILVKVVEVFKRLWEIIGYLSIYERVEFGNKVPYLSAPFMVLIDIGNTIQRSEEVTEPALQIIEAIIPDLQDIFMREFERLKGRADLELDLKPKKALFADSVTLHLTVRNRGKSVAENINLRIVAQNENRFSILGSGENVIDILSPQREESIEFTIKPYEAGKLRISFEIEYNDLEKSGKIQQFADLVEVSGTLEEEFAQTTIEFYNPYIVGLPVEGDMFFGREDVFQFIQQRLSGHSQKAIIVLRGQRRTGKTSVLLQLQHRLDEKYIPVFIDMQGFTDTGMDRFLYGIAYLIAEELEERNIYIEQPQQEQFSVAPGAFFRDKFLNQVLDKIEYRHLLLLFDEFEVLEKRIKDGKLDEDIFPLLRNLMQHTERLDFIFAGTHRLQEMTQNYWSILFNIAVYQDIAFMKQEEVEALIRNPVKDAMYYDDLAVDKIIRMTAGHPYFVQLICSLLTNDYIKTKKFSITLQDVNRILKDVLEGGAVHFDFIWKESSPDEQLILAVLANIITREGAAAGLSDVENILKKYGLAIEANRIAEAVKSLVTREVLEADLETFRWYQFKIDLIRLWVNRYQSLGIIVDDSLRKEKHKMGK